MESDRQAQPVLYAVLSSSWPQNRWTVPFGLVIAVPSIGFWLNFSISRPGIGSAVAVEAMNNVAATQQSVMEIRVRCACIESFSFNNVAVQGR